MNTCPTCQNQNKIVNQCGCDLNNSPTLINAAAVAENEARYQAAVRRDNALRSINQPAEHNGQTGFWCQGISVFIADTKDAAQAVANYRKRLAEGNIAVQHSSK